MHPNNMAINPAEFGTDILPGTVEVPPTSYLYNPKGEQVSYQADEVTRASLEAYIKKK